MSLSGKVFVLEHLKRCFNWLSDIDHQFSVWQEFQIVDAVRAIIVSWIEANLDFATLVADAHHTNVADLCKLLRTRNAWAEHEALFTIAAIAFSAYTSISVSGSHPSSRFSCLLSVFLTFTLALSTGWLALLTFL